MTLFFMPLCGRVVTRDVHSCLARVLSPAGSISRLLLCLWFASRFLKASGSQRMTETKKFKNAWPLFLVVVKFIGRSVLNLWSQRVLDVAASVAAATAALLSLFQLDSRISVGIEHELPRFQSARKALNFRGFLDTNKS